MISFRRRWNPSNLSAGKTLLVSRDLSIGREFEFKRDRLLLVGFLAGF
jgi:hypothetical protein